MIGMDEWYTANMLTSGDIKPPARLAIEPKPEAVCLKQETVLRNTEFEIHTNIMTGGIFHSLQWNGRRDLPKRCWKQLLSIQTAYGARPVNEKTSTGC